MCINLDELEAIVHYFFFVIIYRMNSIHDCVLFDEDSLPWQIPSLMTMAASSSSLWGGQMNLTTNTLSLERFGKFLLK